MQQLVAQYKMSDHMDKVWVLQHDRQLHELLARSAGNKFLYHDFEQYYNLSIRIWHLALSRIRAEDINVEAHIDILGAIEAGNCLQAEGRMRQHIKHFHNTIKQYL